ncbi:hypothetical protein LNKW23_44750 [Paralimibaculum aggregatum]|uniref:Uncharacterized protein n=1 Tax=Paralimibaculum aggregatum TaxID=3036245 RepID=A0ABQ6LT63_9RHOB|nr:hypothetical protein [Limibaculum sp. NKW23]GMG85258.1 hypothetical protein LNKW23_44750 [Limibaculum sp. NKW23]
MPPIIGPRPAPASGRAAPASGRPAPASDRAGHASGRPAPASACAAPASDRAAGCRRRLGAFALGLALALGAAAPLAPAPLAAAAEIAPLRLGNWQGGAYSDDRTGAFSHCAASARYRSGITLLFSVTRERSWSMGVSSPDWRLRPGATYPIRYRVDGGAVHDAAALARSPVLAQVMLPASERLFLSFRKGRMLRIAAAGRVLEFRLDGTARLLTALLGCARRFAGTGGGDPSAGGRQRGRAPGIGAGFRSRVGDQTTQTPSS